MCCCQLGIPGWCGVLVGFRSYRRSEKKWDFDWHKSAIHGIFTLRIPSKTLFLVNVRSWMPISPSWKDQIRVPLNHISVVPCFFMEQIEDVLPEKSQYLGHALRSVEMWQPRKSTAPWQLWDRCTHFIGTERLPCFCLPAIMTSGWNVACDYLCVACVTKLPRREQQVSLVLKVPVKRFWLHDRKAWKFHLNFQEQAANKHSLLLQHCHEFA